MTAENIDFSRFHEMGDDLLPCLDELRAHDPIHWSAANGVWIVTDHAAVVEGFSGRLPLSAGRHEIVRSFFPNPEDHGKIANLMRLFPHFLTNTDPPEHARLRKLLMMAFSKQVAESYRPFVREIVADTIANLDGKVEIDFVDEFARFTTARVILKVMGLPADLLSEMERWAQVINEGLSGNPDPGLMIKADDVFGEMSDIFQAEIDRRRAGGSFMPGDFLSQIMDASDGDDSLNDEEVIAQLILVLIAGHDTTLNTMALSVAKLSGHPEILDYMRGNPDKFEPCIMELMRVVAMSTMMGRIASEDFEWRGRSIKKGQFVFLMIAGANRDPEAFGAPTTIDVTRNQGKNMTFAPGRHFCVGHWFAKMMMSEALPAFFAKYRRWDVLDENLVFNSAASFRGITRLGLRLHKFEK